ncbi:MAG: polysaccharide biosynthesis protein [Bacteroidaceae bacterium]|nr:polysaccharide biosynthesis protein [Bacteroidaceae bacterium]
MNLLNPLNKYVSRFMSRYMSTRMVFLLDMVMSVAASLVMLALIDLFLYSGTFSWKLLAVWTGFATVFSFLFIWQLRTYRIIIRHMTLREMALFILVAGCKAVATGIAFGLMFSFAPLLYIMVVADFFLTFGLFFLLRIAMLFVYNLVMVRMDYKAQNHNVLVYGIDIKSVSLLSRFKDSAHYNVVGFIQFGNSEVNHVISEKKVYYVGSEEEYERVVKRLNVQALLFATEADAREERDRIIRYSMELGIKLLFAPPVDEMVDGRPAHIIRNIEIEDLLMRPEINISMDEIVANFRDKTVMVTGAAGSIGSELCRQLATFGIKELILFDNAETPMHNLRLELEEKFPELKFVPIIGDVRLTARLDYAFRKWRPQVVFHAAAYKHVPLMEENPCEAVLVNVAGSRNVADKCIEYDVEKMVMISTDKAVNPTNIMGCTKRLAEIYVQSLGLATENGLKPGRTKFVTTRFGNVLGSNGSVIPRFREQIAKGGPVTVTHPEITRFFMTIPEACRLVMEAATMSTGNEIYVFDMGESVKIDDLARRMIKLAGYKPDQDIMIEYSGLRPGEKLYEEVLSSHENTLPTDHQRIRIAKVRDYDYSDALQIADELERLSRIVEIPDMVRLMKQTVPEYISNNSQFQEFDKN